MTYAPHYSRAGHGIYTRLPDLPAGWEWVQSPHLWLIARDPFGREYFTEFLPENRFILTRRSRAKFWDWVRTFGAVNPGQEYMDQREQIESAQLNIQTKV
jgi:hypothetical protein